MGPSAIINRSRQRSRRSAVQVLSPTATRLHSCRAADRRSWHPAGDYKPSVEELLKNGWLASARPARLVTSRPCSRPAMLRHSLPASYARRDRFAVCEFEHLAVCQRRNPAELLDQLLVLCGDGMRLPIEIVKPALVDVASLLGELNIPINLVGQAVPREPQDGNSIAAHPQDVGPLFPQPFRIQLR